MQYRSRTALLVLGLCLVPQVYAESTTPQSDAHGVHGMVLFGEPLMRLTAELYATVWQDTDDLQ